MAIDINRLSPAAQAQIARKIAEQERMKRIAAPQKTAPRNGGGENGLPRRSAPCNEGDRDTSSVCYADSFPSKGSQRKYHNSPTERIAEGGKTIKFSSKAEARRFDELFLLYKAGKIAELKLQPQFTLQESYVTPEGNRVRAIKYVADFSYQTGNGLVVEDVKGGNSKKGTQTRVYKLKKKLMQDKFGITVQEIGTCD